jgi:lipoyl-dependent peroxiredoxin
MALAGLLESAGTPADRIHTEAEVTIRLVDGTPTITRIDLATLEVVPGVDELGFVEHALTPRPVGRALAWVPEVNLVATLDNP